MRNSYLNVVHRAEYHLVHSRSHVLLSIARSKESSSPLAIVAYKVHIFDGLFHPPTSVKMINEYNAR